MTTLHIWCVRYRCTCIASTFGILFQYAASNIIFSLRYFHFQHQHTPSSLPKNHDTAQKHLVSPPTAPKRCVPTFTIVPQNNTETPNGTGANQLPACRMDVGIAQSLHPLTRGLPVPYPPPIPHLFSEKNTNIHVPSHYAFVSCHSLDFNSDESSSSIHQ
jgi:hypothetical protein